MASGPTLLRLSDRAVDLDTGRVDDGAELRPMELKVLRYLAARLDQTVSHRELLVGVWGYARKSRSTTVYSTLYRLRQVLEADPTSPRHVQTVPGAGVRLTGLPDDAPRTNTRPALDAFVGREPLLVQLAADPRLVTLLGISGAGKSRLAHEHAQRSLTRFPGGCWSCDLSTATTPAAVAERVCAAMNFVGPHPRDLDVDRAALGPALARRGRLLLVLDHVEAHHDLASDVAQWLAEAPELHVVATARAPLGVAGEQRLLVGRLDQALALFLDRARAAEPTFEADRSVGALLDALDHLPLAIEIAAGHAALIGTSATLAALSGQGALQSRRTDHPDRHRSLDDLVAWTCAALAPDRQHGLACLAAFTSSFGLPAAERVLDSAGCPLDAPTLVAELRERGLVQPAEPGRFRLVSIVARALRARSLPPGAADGHAAYYGDLAFELFEARDRRPPATDPHDGVEVDEVLAAARRRLAVDPDGAVPLVLWAQAAAACARRTSEAVAITSETLRAPLSAEGRVLVQIASEELHRAQGRRRQASELRSELVLAASEAGRPDLAATLELGAAMDHRNRGSLAEASAAVARALRWWAEVASTPRSEARFRGAVANVRASLLDPRDPEVARCYREAVSWLEGDDPVTAAAVRANLGGALTEQDRHDEAAHQLQEGLRGTPAQCGAQRATALAKLSTLLWARGEVDDAEEVLEAALDLGRQTGDPSLLPFLWNQRARLHLDRGAHEPGLAAAEHALGLVRDAEQHHSETVARRLCGRAARLLGRPEAEAWLWSSFRLGETLGAPWLQCPAALELVWLRVAQSRPDEALSLVGRLLERRLCPLRAAELLLLQAELDRRAGRSARALAALERVASTGSPTQAARATLARAALSAELGHAPDLDRVALPSEASPWLRVLAARLALALGDPRSRDVHLLGLRDLDGPPDDTLLWLGHRELADA
jgi:tetratricopeptide (TPR) repeat protein